MQKGEHLYAGKAKSVFLTDDPKKLILRFRNDTSAFDGEKTAQLDRKGKVNNHFNAFVMEKLEQSNCVVGNIDCTIILEKPKLFDHISSMKVRLCKLLRLSEKNVNIKATTNEGMGFIGRNEGLAAFSVVTVVQL